MICMWQSGEGATALTDGSCGTTPSEISSTDCSPPSKEISTSSFYPHYLYLLPPDRKKSLDPIVVPIYPGKRGNCSGTKGLNKFHDIQYCWTEGIGRKFSTDGK